MGMGVDATGDALMLRRAVGRAMNEVLGDPALVSLAADVRRGEQGDSDDRDPQQQPCRN